MLFQSFMSVGKIPPDWKSAVITPLYKKDVSSGVMLNYAGEAGDAGEAGGGRRRLGPIVVARPPLIG